MNFQEELKEFRAREKYRGDAVNFIHMARSMDQRTKPREICPYLAICSNTEEAISYGFANTTMGMDPSIDCVGGPRLYSQCPLFQCNERRLIEILTVIDQGRNKMLELSSQQEEASWR